jgi:hypothetical protein
MISFAFLMTYTVSNAHDICVDRLLVKLRICFNNFIREYKIAQLSPPKDSRLLYFGIADNRQES